MIKEFNKFDTNEKKLISSTAVLRRVNFWNNEYKKRYLINNYWDEIQPYIEELNDIFEYFKKSIGEGTNILTHIDKILEHMFISIFFNYKNENYIQSWIHIDKKIKRLLIGYLEFYKKFKLFPHQIISLFNMIDLFNKYSEIKNKNNCDIFFIENLNQYNNFINFCMNYDNGQLLKTIPHIRDLSKNHNEVSIKFDISNEDFDIEKITNEIKFNICLLRYIRNTIIESKDWRSSYIEYLNLEYYFQRNNFKYSGRDTSDDNRFIGLIVYDIIEYHNKSFFPYFSLIKKINNNYNYVIDKKILYSFNKISQRKFMEILIKNNILQNIIDEEDKKEYMNNLKIDTYNSKYEIDILNEYKSKYLRRFNNSVNTAKKCVKAGKML